MTGVPAKVLISEAATAFRLLNGVVCVYKPVRYSKNRIVRELKGKLCADLNQMKPPPRDQRVEIRRVKLSQIEEESRTPLEQETVLASYPDGRDHRVEVVKGLSYSDHPGILGGRYKPEDFKMVGTGPSSREISGVHLIGVNGGTQTARRIYLSRWLRTYLVSGRFGIATDTGFHDGRICEKSTFGNVKKHMLQNLLLSMQATHQKLAFEATGVPVDSDRAYELASKGLVRPDSFSSPVTYAFKLVSFDLPDFTIEMKIVNENFEYLKTLIHHLGTKLHSTAVCTKIQCTTLGPFGLEDALLLKHWGVEHVLENMKMVERRLEKFNTFERNPWIREIKPVVKPLDEVVKEEEDDTEAAEEGDGQKEMEGVEDDMHGRKPINFKASRFPGVYEETRFQ